MGPNTRRPILPAPTESIVDTVGSSATGTDLGTDISRRTDKTSYSIPDDGSPVIIPTRRKHRSRGEDSKLSRSAHHSQTSLLIEYFEGGKGSGAIVSRPSVRVRVTPSSGKKSKDPSVHITDSSGNRRPSYSRRISFGSPSKQKSGSEAVRDDLSYTDSADENHPPGPVEIELVNREQGSELSSMSRDRRYLPTSDVSSMPADSMLEASSAGPRRKRSQSLERAVEEPEPKDYLKTPSRQRSRSLSTERIAQRAAEKVNNYSRDASTKRRREKGRRTAADYQEVESKSPRHRGLPKDDEMASPESSLLSASAVSSHRRSGDQYSFRSNTSKSSLNNPKLLETVEDAIRRLILPELKELKKDQKVISNTSKFERDLNTPHSSASSSSRDGLGRRLSKHASAPNVRKPKVVLNKDSRDEGIVLAGDSFSSQKERRASRDSETTSDAGYVKGLRPDLTEQDMVRRQRSKGLRDAEKAAIVGSRLTTNNLKHHESNSSLDKYESRRDHQPKGINETELVFQRHNVAPMPLRSAIESDLMTRDSILSDQTLEPETARGDMMRATPRGSRHDLGFKHSNMSSHNLSIHSASDNDRREWSHSPFGEAGAGAIAAAAAANLLDPHSDHHELDYGDHLNARRALSPIQSVTSNQSEYHVRQGSTQHISQEFSGDDNGVEPRLSIDSLSSAPSTSLARSKRPEGISAESQDEIIRNQKESGPDLGYEGSSLLSPQSPRDKHWLEESDGEGELYRHSLAGSASTEAKHMPNYPDDSEVDFIERANQGHPVAEGIRANPQFIHPTAVESAVASILDPSILDTKSNQSGGSRSHSHSNTFVQQESNSTRSLPQSNEAAQTSRQGSPLKQRQDASSPDATSFPRRMGVTSPPQSVTQSLDDLTDPIHIYPSQHGENESPAPQDRDLSPETESEINTNPSIIQGPIGGIAHDSAWLYEQSSAKGQSPLFDGVGIAATAAAAGAGMGLTSGGHTGYDHDYYPEDEYNAGDYHDQQYTSGPAFGTPPGAKDEGYVSAANPISPSPEAATKGFGGIDTNGLGLFDSPTGADDQFGSSHQRHFSGYSHGVGSPLYDSATGKGIERIQSQDIVALMDHLTVRDAQRNARDTEILVTLVRSAAEMRNSFEEMKKFISQQDGVMLEANERQHERTFKAIGGPRPLPVSGRTRQTSMDDGDDSPAKRKNVFKRALKGLSLKSSTDLTRIEEMLEQLLDEMDALRAGQDDMMRSGNRGGPASVDLDGYEPEGHAGTSSPGDHSGFLSTSSRAAPEPRGSGLRRGVDTRVSTVPEEDDEDIDERGEFLSPQLPLQETAQTQRERAGSEPLSTPPRGAVASGALSNSNETTPKTNEKSRKHKSSSSSFFPKISRWSKTTASSMGDNIRNSVQPGRKERVSFDTSRSGSDLAPGAYKTADYYDSQGDDRIRSNYTVDEGLQQENRPPSPLVPSQVSEAPKYRAHRDSLDLQHPQPRQGPTGRYQSQLETQAQIYGAPTNHSDQWGSNPSLSAPNGNRRVSGGSRLSPISDAGYSESSSRTGRQGPPRPPKVKDEGPLFPERPPKVKEGEEQSYADRVASRSSAMRSPRSTPPTRKPTGPRPLNSGSQYNSPNRRRRNYRDSPEQVDDEHDY